MEETERFAFILVEDFSHLAFSCAIEPLRIANLLTGKEIYSWSLVSKDGHGARSSNGSITLTDYSYDDLPSCDRLFVLSGINVEHKKTPKLLSVLRQKKSRGVKLGALCSGAYVIAKAGLLNGQSASIHWEFHDSFMESFPEVNLVRSVFVADDKVISAAGGAATADLMLHLIKQRHGAELAFAVADQMVYIGARDADGDQRLLVGNRPGVRNKHLKKAIDIMIDNLETPVPASTISKGVGISRRQVERLFGRYLQCSPKRYYLELRLERARGLLLHTDQPIVEVASACGFEYASHFAKSYRSRFGVPPSTHRLAISGA